MQKRGQIEVDWVISLSIFMLYLTFFFIYIRPMLSPIESMESLISVAKEGMEKNITWSVETVPFFISSNVSAVDEPVIVPLPYPWRPGSFALASKEYFLFEEGKIFFLANASSKAEYWLSHTDEASYSLGTPVRDLSATASSASVSKKDFRAEFENNIIKRVEHKGKYRLTNFNLSLEGTTITAAEIINKSTNITPVVAQYKILTQSMNHSAYVFAENSRIYSYARLYSPALNFTVSATLGNYTKYYSDETHSGVIEEIGCSSFFGKYIDIYETLSGMTFITSENSNISICNANGTAELKIRMDLKNETKYDIILHSGDYTATQQYLNYYKTEFGMVENLTGWSEQRINRTNLTYYKDLKKQWDYPEERDFSFYITNASDTAMYSYEPEPTGSAANVYVKKLQGYVIDEYGDKKLYTLRLRVW